MKGDGTMADNRASMDITSATTTAHATITSKKKRSATELKELKRELDSLRRIICLFIVSAQRNDCFDEYRPDPPLIAVIGGAGEAKSSFVSSTFRALSGHSEGVPVDQFGDDVLHTTKRLCIRMPSPAECMSDIPGGCTTLDFNLLIGSGKGYTGKEEERLAFHQLVRSACVHNFICVSSAPSSSSSDASSRSASSSSSSATSTASLPRINEREGNMNDNGNSDEDEIRNISLESMFQQIITKDIDSLEKITPETDPALSSKVHELLGGRVIAEAIIKHNRTLSRNSGMIQVLNLRQPDNSILPTPSDIAATAAQQNSHVFCVDCNYNRQRDEEDQVEVDIQLLKILLAALKHGNESPPFANKMETRLALGLRPDKPHTPSSSSFTHIRRPGDFCYVQLSINQQLRWRSVKKIPTQFSLPIILVLIVAAVGLALILRSVSTTYRGK